MALEKPSGGGSNRRPSFQGRVVQRTSRGQEISQAWPKARGKNLHPKTKAQMDFFRQVQWAFKYASPALTQQYTDAVKGTPLLPRDLFLSAMAGRMLAFYTPSGRMVTSMAAQNDVSTTLDFLGSDVGSILIRTPDGWVALSPGDNAQVLTMQGDPALPAWADAGGGGGGQSTLMPPPTNGDMKFTVSTNVAANVSYNLTQAWSESEYLIDRLRVPILGSPSGIYRPVLYDWCAIGEIPASTLGAPLVATGPEHSFVNGPSVQDIMFDAPFLTTPGRIYLIGLFKRAAAIQTSFAQLAYAKTNYFSTTVYAAPQDPLPALGIGTNQALSHWTA